MRRLVASLGLLLLPALAACSSQRVDTSADIAVIDKQMHARFDKPGARLESGPIAVSGDHAVADWTQGAMGGRALFERRDGQWEILLCGGEQIKEASYLEQARIPKTDAMAIAHELHEAERKVPAERLARMRSFSGVITAEQMPGANN